MDSYKLFQVLVTGGVLLASGCREEPAPSADAGPADGATQLDAGANRLCFCPDDCCETDATGTSHVRDGIECCWSTSC